MVGACGVAEVADEAGVTEAATRMSWEYFRN